jgi:hypothetical protein
MSERHFNLESANFQAPRKVTPQSTLFAITIPLPLRALLGPWKGVEKSGADGSISVEIAVEVRRRCRHQGMGGYGM